jgi:O-antigen ligase
MPLPLIAFSALVSLLLVLRQFRFIVDWPSRLLILFLWARFVVSAPHEITTIPRVAGLSISAMVTMSFAAALVVTATPRDLRDRHLVRYLPLFAIFAVSTVLNRSVKGFIMEAIQWTLFVGVFHTVRVSLAVNGLGRTMKAVMCACVTPALLQILSMATRTTIGNELDGSLGYIGGYLHESIFSRMMLIFLVAAMLVPWRNAAFYLGFAFYGLASIMLSNYRTTILATLPIVAFIGASTTLGVFRSRYRAFVFASLALVGLLAFIAVFPYLPERYLTIVEVMGKADRLIKPPLHYTFDEARYFSSRFYIWAQHLELYVAGRLDQLLFGFGPFAFDNRIKHNAHSSYVAYLTEYGVAGLVALIALLLANTAVALRIPDVKTKLQMLSLHVGFMILNLTTLAMKSIEGLVLYGMIVSVTVSLARRRSPRPRRRPVAPPMPAALVAERASPSG